MKVGAAGQVIFGRVTFGRAVCATETSVPKLCALKSVQSAPPAGGFMFAAYLDLESQPQLPGWVGVCEFK